MYIGGAFQSAADDRDFLYSKVAFTAESLPSKASVRQYIKYPAFNQGNFGTCVGAATKKVMEILKAKDLPDYPPELADLYVYTQCKIMDGDVQEGTYPRNAMKTVTNFGICYEKTLPYNTLVDATKLPAITPEMNADAAKFKISSYAKVTAIEDLKHSLAMHESPVLVALYLCDNFRYPDNGYVDLPSGTILGGHAMCVIGYDDNEVHVYPNGSERKGFFDVANSWSPQWGIDGFCKIPYDYFNYRTKNTLMPFWMESWTVVNVLSKINIQKSMKMWIGKTEAIVDGKPYDMKVAPTIVPEVGYTLVPLRFISEVLGYQVYWNSVERSITIYK